MGCNVERVLGEIGQSLRPMREAPRDGRGILGKIASVKTTSGKTAAGLVICYWDAEPLKLAGPSWVEIHDAERGYLDRYFAGWVDPAGLKLWDYAALADLLIAYIDDAHASGDTKTLQMLDRRLTGRDETNRSRDNRPM
jgi:hypothetical protein